MKKMTNEQVTARGLCGGRECKAAVRRVTRTQTSHCVRDSASGARRDNVDLGDSDLRYPMHYRKEIPLTIVNLSSHIQVNDYNYYKIKI